jgi:hypothetical protein
MEKVFLEVIAGAANVQVIPTVHAVEDSMSYACFEVHTQDSLEKMNKVWSAIYENKPVFSKLRIREISTYQSSTPSIIHYVSSIRSNGTLDGYNTESPEQLHIKFTKVPFREGNRKDYHQMAT